MLSLFKSLIPSLSKSSFTLELQSVLKRMPKGVVFSCFAHTISTNSGKINFTSAKARMFAEGIQHYGRQGMKGNEIMPVHHALNATSITKESVLQQGMIVKHSHHRV